MGDRLNLYRESVCFQETSGNFINGRNLVEISLGFSCSLIQRTLMHVTAVEPLGTLERIHIQHLISSRTSKITNTLSNPFLTTFCEALKNEFFIPFIVSLHTDSNFVVYRVTSLTSFDKAALLSG